MMREELSFRVFFVLWGRWREERGRDTKKFGVLLSAFQHLFEKTAWIFTNSLQYIELRFICVYITKSDVVIIIKADVEMSRR